MSLSRIVVFSAGDRIPGKGGTGFKNLIYNNKVGNLKAEIVCGVSNYEKGSIDRLCEVNKIPFEHFVLPKDKEEAARAYQAIVEKYKPDFVILSGWLKMVFGLDPAKTINIHPGPLLVVDADGKPVFGGPGMHGDHVHNAVIASDSKFSGVSMHFVTEKYDEGPVFFQLKVIRLPDDTPETLAERVKDSERSWQWYPTNLVLNGNISWSGDKDDLVLVTADYKRQPFCPPACVATLN